MNNLIDKLKEINKVYYTINDLIKISGYSKESLFVTLSRLVNQKRLLRLASGIYILEDNSNKVDFIANTIYSPSYLSFESALSRYGILSQSVYILTFATQKKSLKKILGNIEVEYRQINKSLFGDYKKDGELLIATPEKALLDSLYFVSWGKMQLSLKSLDLKEINKSMIINLSKKFPLRTRRLLDSVLKDK